MNAQERTRQTSKLTGFASGVSFVFGMAHAVGNEKVLALLAFLATIILYGVDIEFKERKGG